MMENSTQSDLDCGMYDSNYHLVTSVTWLMMTSFTNIMNLTSFRVSTLAPLSRSNFTISKCPPSAAEFNGVWAS
jgi:hypothetical protein